jgi:hypothetical protein
MRPAEDHAGSFKQKFKILRNISQKNKTFQELF